jgi:hypothetical protein
MYTATRLEQFGPELTADGLVDKSSTRNAWVLEISIWFNIRTIRDAFKILQ